MGKKHKHLTEVEREQIARWLSEGLAQETIAQRLGRDPSSIRREVGRGWESDCLGSQEVCHDF